MGTNHASNGAGSPESSSQPAWSFRQTIPSDTSVGSSLVDQLLDAMVARDWPPAELFRVQLAYEEAIVNAIRHGNRCDPDKTVDLQMECDDHRVRIQITDQGAGFDPAAVPDPRDQDLLEVPGGRGVLLISEIMSEVTYSATGNQITMVKIKGDKPQLDDD